MARPISSPGDPMKSKMKNQLVGVAYMYRLKRLLPHLLGALLTFSTVVFSQQISNEERLKQFNKSAVEALKAGNYGAAIENFKARLPFLPAGDSRAPTLYNIGCCYALNKEIEPSLAYLDSAVSNGFIRYKLMEKDTDLEYLRQNVPADFDQLVGKVRERWEAARLENTPIAVIEWDNFYDGTAVMSDLRLAELTPALDSLRQKYALTEVFGQNAADWASIKRLLDWVSNRWQHDGNRTAGTSNALEILERAENGERFACVDYAITMTKCLAAVGYPARYIGLRQPGIAAPGFGQGHSCTEVWCNEFQKWVLLDPQNDAWWESDQRPLSAVECRDRHLEGRDSDLRFIGQHKDADYSKLQEQWVTYFYNLSFPYDTAYVVLVGEHCLPEIFFGGAPDNTPIVHNSEALYPSLNRTAIELIHPSEKASDTLIVRLAHTMPYFDKFVVRIDDGDWVESVAEFRWILNDGLNSLEAKALSRSGVEGRPSRIVLMNNLAGI